MVDKAYLGVMLKKHGGSTHGPNVETVSIPEAAFYHMMEEITVVAAIEAICSIRDPTPEMMAASRPALKQIEDIIASMATSREIQLNYPDGKPPLWHAWQAMIDAALATRTEPGT